MRKLFEDYFELVFEAPADDIISDLKTLVEPEVVSDEPESLQRQSGNTVVIRVPNNKRREVLQHLLTTLPNAEFDPSKGGSLGRILYKSGSILVKPAGKTGEKSAGVGNELELVKELKDMLANYSNGITVIFKSATSEMVVENVTDVTHSGRQTKGRLKGDVQLVTKDANYPISLKKLSADVWESADTYFGQTAVRVLTKLITDKKVKLTKLGYKNQQGKDYVSISPEVAIEPTKEETQDVIFGEDISKMSGAVIIQTFEPQHFIRQDDKIIIECETIIRKLKDIPKSHLMVWLIRNDKTRNTEGGIPGLRITASILTRAFGKHGTKENILYVNRDGLELSNPMADEAERYFREKEKKEKEKKQTKPAKPAAITGKRVKVRPIGSPRTKRDVKGLGREKR